MSFFYNLFGDNMKIYVDMVIMLNFFLDFLLLMGVSLILKRNVKIIRLILGAIVGAISILTLFISISSLTLFIIKLIISVIMVLTSFGFKNLKYTINNLVYLYLLSIILGGFLYFVNDELSYKHEGLIFFHNGLGINVILILLLSPIIIFIYIKKSRKLKWEYSKFYEVKITFLNGKEANLTGFLDTGNDLYDPYKKRPILIINELALKGYNPRCVLVPCFTVNKESMIRCFKIKKLVVNGKKIDKEVMVGISDNNFNIEGAQLLLHKNILKGEEK